ncbi:MAG: type II secretion system protein [bacterium]
MVPSVPRFARPGFTLIELLVVITIIGILAAIALPNYIKAKNKAKEVQVIAGAHSIQIAVERYAVDNNRYPPFLIGGDIEGWKNWHGKYDEPNPDPSDGANRWVVDPLISYAYLSAYPENPFVDEPATVVASTSNGGSQNPGDGDPRFGFNGRAMGNGLETPQWHRIWSGDGAFKKNMETRRTLIASGASPATLGFPDSDSNTGLIYSFGGRRTFDANGDPLTVAAYWPGNFFYRALNTMIPVNAGVRFLPNPSGFYVGNYDRYILGGYGALNTLGKDVIRLERFDPDGKQAFFRNPPPFPEIVTANNGQFSYSCEYKYAAGRGGLPCVAGGGNAFLGPFWPPDGDPDLDHDFIYGAPDGEPDGVVIALTSGAEVQAY